MTDHEGGAVRVAILGPLRVTAAHGEVEITGTRLRALLIRLALDPGRLVTTARLIDDLWESGPPANPAAALQSLVSRLRRVLAERDAVVSHPAGYRLGIPLEHVDAWAFERTATRGLTALRDRDIPLASRELHRALSLWRGPALADAAAYTFAAAPAARLEETRLTALAARIDTDLALTPSTPDDVTETSARPPYALGGGAAALVAELEELVTTHPAREPFHARLILALCAAGRRADALDTYERLRAALADRLGVDPGPELRQAHLTALRTSPPDTPLEPPHLRTPAPLEHRTAPAPSPLDHDPSTPPSPRPAAHHFPFSPTPEPLHRRQGNLPVPLTSLVGRTEDLTRIGRLLTEARLVTLTGPGGAGKTRLAVEAASNSTTPDGPWLVELSYLSHPPSDITAGDVTAGGVSAPKTETGDAPAEAGPDAAPRGAPAGGVSAGGVSAGGVSPGGVSPGGVSPGKTETGDVLVGAGPDVASGDAPAGGSPAGKTETDGVPVEAGPDATAGDAPAEGASAGDVSPGGVSPGKTEKGDAPVEARPDVASGDAPAGGSPAGKTGTDGVLVGAGSDAIAGDAPAEGASAGDVSPGGVSPGKTEKVDVPVGAGPDVAS
ncbi:AfsR/SARP family transcriptional regulator, partial [Sphaerisporangium aureirubrum]